MRGKGSKRILSLVLCLLLMASNSITALATSVSGNEPEEVVEATTVLADVESAQQSLKELVAEREIPALLYLKDIYTIKTEPDSNSNDVASIASGQQVYITGVGEDRGHNIWYQVTYSYDGGDLSGYIQREYLAFSDERMIEWEGMNIRSRQMFKLRRSGVSYADVEQFPESYKDALYDLKQQHPNWKFVKMETGLDWNYVVTMQSEADRSLVWNNTALDSWKDGYYSSSWAIASDGIIKYYLDPRNALTESLVFQFEQLTYNKSYHSLESTQKVIQGTFMDDVVPGTAVSYAQAFMDIAEEQNISPVLMAARVRQEQGVKGTSPMISGTYPGFEGLYNYYNVGASGNTQEKELETGLTKAREMGWTTPMLSLSGGSTFLSNKYIRKGQDTLYLQKFDVDSSFNGVCWHQYMQNIAAPESESLSTYRAYSNAGIVDSAFVFKIPVYRNMPDYACTKPGSEEKVTLNVASIDNLPVDATAVLVSYINGSQNTSVAMQFESSDTNVATVDSNGVVTGISPGQATITCKRAENAESATTASCTVNVIKADIAVSKIEIPDIEVTYSRGQKLSSIKLPKGFAWVDGNIIPVVGNKGYNASYNPDNSKYNTVTLTIPVTVNKAVIDSGSITLPTGLTAVAGYELSSVTLPMGYAWDNPTEKLPKKTGTYSYGASYCIDEVNYEVLEDITLSVEIVCKTHEYGSWQGNHADCVNKGELTRVCNICGAKETVTENALGHEYDSEVTKEPTLLAPGTRTYTCIRCKDTYDVEIPVVVGPHKHEYAEEITIQPTCENTGIKKFTCECKDTYTEVVEALGHDLVDGACTRCDYAIPTLPQHSHLYTLSGSTETCISDGVATYICGCGDSYTEEKKALGHEVIDGKCTRCEYTEPLPDEEENNEGTTGGDDSGTAGGNNSGSAGTTGGNTSGTTGGDDSGTAGGNNSGSAGTTGGNTSGTTGGDNSGTTGDNNSGSAGTTGGDNSDTTGGNNSGSAGTTGGNTSGTTGGDNSGTTGGSNGGTTGTTGGNNSGNTGTTGGDNSGTIGDNNSGTTGTTGGNNSGSAGTTGGNTSGTTGGDNSGTTGSNNSSTTGSGNTDSNAGNNNATDTGNNQGLLGAVQNIISSFTGEQNNEQAKVEELPIQPQNNSENSVDGKKSEATEEDTVVETEDAVKITMKHSTMLNRDKLAIVTNTNRSLELVMADNVKWNVDLSGVDDVHNINIDMAVKMNEAEIPEEVLTTLPQENPIILMSLSHEGPFEFDAKLTVPVNKLNVGKYANLYYYNPVTEAMEFIAASVVAEDGTAEFMMAHASDYAIVIADNSLDPNPPQELAEAEPEEETEPAVETVSEGVAEAGMPAWLTIVIIAVVVIIAIVGIVLGVRFFKKKSEDNYYFDDEDEEVKE